MRATTLCSWAQLVARALERRGIDAGPLFARAGLEIRRLADPNARYAFDGMQRLWSLAVEATGDPDFGLEAAAGWHPTTWHALGYAWLASATLRDAFARAVRYGRMVSDSAAGELVDTPGGAWLRVRPRPGLPTGVRASQDAMLATLVSLSRTSAGEGFRPLAVRFAYPRPARTGPLRDFFRAPLEFDADFAALELAAADLDAELPTANAELARVNERVVVEYLQRFDRGNLSLRVRTELLRQLPSGRASETGIAAALALTPRTMQRRLRAEQTTYSQLVDEVRRELAAEYVRESDLSISEITYLLGFSEPSNFSRAFKRWTGRPPSDWRARRRA